MRKLAALLVLLTGCSTTSQMVLPDGRQGHLVTCERDAITNTTTGRCMAMAGQLCPRGYDVVRNDGDSMVVACRTGAVTTTSAPSSDIDTPKFMTCSQLSAECGTGSHGFCLGAALAAADVYSYVVDAYSPAVPRLACLPAGTSGAEIETAVKTWLTQHPERLRNTSALCLTEALLNAFPCPAK